ncbi:hypothetical protein BpHYR1_000311, partial [Brachionus plicatilis]
NYIIKYSFSISSLKMVNFNYQIFADLILEKKFTHFNENLESKIIIMLISNYVKTKNLPLHQTCAFNLIQSWSKAKL